MAENKCTSVAKEVLKMHEPIHYLKESIDEDGKTERKR